MERFAPCEYCNALDRTECGCYARPVQAPCSVPSRPFGCKCQSLQEENARMRGALEKAWALIEGIQRDGEKYLIPDNECNRDWFVNRTLWHTDGPAQRDAQAAREAALK